MFWRKKKKEKPNARIILGMILLIDNQSFDLGKVVQDLRDNYNNEIGELTGDEAVAVFDVDEQQVAISFMPVPVPGKDIENTAQYAYNWPTAVSDLTDHKAHLIVSILGGSEDPVERFRTFTQIVCALLRTTNAIGVYKGSQSLLIPKEDYLGDAGLMSEDYLPLNLWVYFGLRQQDQKRSGYTYGLAEFGKTEMEVLDSANSVEDIRAFLFNMSHYVLEFDVEFKDGETCGLSEEEKIKIGYSKGKLVDGMTFKLAY